MKIQELLAPLSAAELDVDYDALVLVTIKDRHPATFSNMSISLQRALFVALAMDGAAKETPH